MGGEVIAGKYQVVKRLGEGSYSTVYLVRHVDLGVPYALKILRKGSAHDESFVERFKHEAGLIQHFSHPGSIQLRDFGRTEDGRYYMTTDFSEGELLEQLLEREGHFAVVRSVKIMIQVLDVLHAAHSQGIVHRDIKPGNIIIERESSGEDLVKVLDFGIATLKQDIPLTTKATLEGVSIGTPAYMSPEQCTAEADLDHRVDIYSAGIMLYELLSGTVPFLGQTVVQTLLKHLTQPPTPFAWELKIPESISEIVFKAIEKEREDRFQSAAEFRSTCEAALAEINRAKAAKAQRPAPETAAANEPRIRRDDTDERKAEPPAPKEERKLLCLDDNEMILQILRHIFEREGYHVYSASNFAVIHDIIFLEKVPVMLCDVNMPGLPGNKICRMLKQVKPKLKIILFSNIPDRDLEKLAKEANADSWLSKNAHPSEWITKVKEIESQGEQSA